MSLSPLIVSILTYAVVIALIYLRRAAGRSGLTLEREHWNVFGLFPVVIAGSSMKHGNVWVAMIALVTAIVGIVDQARLFLNVVPKTDTKEGTPDPTKIAPLGNSGRR